MEATEKRRKTDRYSLVDGVDLLWVIDSDPRGSWRNPIFRLSLKDRRYAQQFVRNLNGPAALKLEKKA